jgi:hypothetical protein
MIDFLLSIATNGDTISGCGDGWALSSIDSHWND